MSRSSPFRKVLVVENDLDIRDTVCNLLARMCEAEVAHSVRNALTSFSEESFDAIMLDLKCPEYSPEQLPSQIQGIQPNLVGRVLVITGEAMSPDILDTIERQWLTHVSPQHLTINLLNAIRTLF